MTDRILLCTDLDRTLLPNGEQEESKQARDLFRQLSVRPEITLAYVSGRHRELVQEAILEFNIPVPDWVIGDVGTTIYQITGNVWRHWHQWEDDIARDWRGKTAQDLKTLFAEISALQLQEASKQNRFKLSYYVDMGTDIAALEESMKQRLNQANVAASLIYSIDEAADIGLLDVLPASATKLHAVEFLIQHQNFALTETVFAGDSGNDLPVLTSAIPSVLVANASRQIADQAQALARQNGNEPFLYLAKGNCFNMNGNYSAGILEGLIHYHPEVQSWLKL